MRKFVVISVNENPEYQLYVPLVLWAWRKFGWEPIVQCVNVKNEMIRLWAEVRTSDAQEGMIFTVPEGYQSDTVAQMARLYAGVAVRPDDYLMTSDADMLPLSDYWKFDPEKITVWGHDLTGYQHMPICYIGMKSSRWREVMGLTSGDYNALLKRDLDSLLNSKSDDKVKRWVVDQDLITERINAVQFEKEFVHRGIYNETGYPVGRVDRSSWTINLHPTFIDCHMPRNINKDVSMLWNITELLEKIWPNENFDWFIKYVNRFNSII